MTSIINRTVPGLAFRYCSMLNQNKIVLIAPNQFGSYDEFVYKKSTAIPFLSGLVTFKGTLTEHEAQTLLVSLTELAEKPNALADIVFAAKSLGISQTDLELQYIKKLTTSGAEYTLDSVVQTPSVQKTLDTVKTMEEYHKSSHTKHMLDLAAELKVIEPIKGLKQVYRSELPELDGYAALTTISRALDGANLPTDILRDMMLEALRAGGMTHHEVQHTLGLLFKTEAPAEEVADSTGVVGYSAEKMQRHVWPGDARFDPNQQNQLYDLWQDSVFAPEYAKFVLEYQRDAINGHRTHRSQTRSMNLSVQHSAECKKRLAKKQMRKQTRRSSKK